MIARINDLVAWVAAGISILYQDQKGSARSWTFIIGMFVLTLLVIVILIYLTPDSVRLVWRKFIMKLLRTLRL